MQIISRSLIRINAAKNIPSHYDLIIFLVGATAYWGTWQASTTFAILISIYMIKSIFWFSCISRLSGAVPAMQFLYFDILLLSRAGPFGRLCDASWQKASAATGGTSCAPGEGEERNILIWTIYFPKRMQIFCTQITNSRHRKSGSFLEHLMIHGNIGFTNHNTFISWSDSDMDNNKGNWTRQLDFGSLQSSSTLVT